MNEVEALPQMMLHQVANDVMLRINDVALCANEAETDHLTAEMPLIFNQRYDIIDL